MQPGRGTYDHANRMTSVTNSVDTFTSAYNGLGDRLSLLFFGNLAQFAKQGLTLLACWKEIVIKDRPREQKRAYVLWLVKIT